MKNLLFVSAAILSVYLIFFSGESYKLENSAYGDSNTFTHSSHGYSVQLPKDYFQPTEDCPLRTNNLELSTYFRAQENPNILFVVGEIEGKFGEHISEKINLLQSNEINEEQFLKRVANPQAISKVDYIDGIVVFSSTTPRQKSSSTMIMFEVEGTVVGFMIAHPPKQTQDVNKIVQSIRRV